MLCLASNCTEHPASHYTMSISAVASLRPLHGSCLRNASSAVLSLSIKSKSTTLQFRALVALPPYQTQRYQSTSRPTPPPSDKKALEGRNSRLKPPKQSVSFGQFIRRALVAGVRNLAFSVSPRGIRQALRDYPTSTKLILLL